MPSAFLLLRKTGFLKATKDAQCCAKKNQSCIISTTAMQAHPKRQATQKALVNATWRHEAKQRSARKSREDHGNEMKWKNAMILVIRSTQMSASQSLCVGRLAAVHSEVSAARTCWSCWNEYHEHWASSESLSQAIWLVHSFFESIWVLRTPGFFGYMLMFTRFDGDLRLPKAM